MSVKIRIITADFIAANYSVLPAFDYKYALRHAPEPPHIIVKFPYLLRRRHVTIISDGEIKLRNHDLTTTQRTFTEKFFNYRRKSILQFHKQFAESEYINFMILQMNT
jgi:hypothetical protein